MFPITREYIREVYLDRFSHFVRATPIVRNDVIRSAKSVLHKVQSRGLNLTFVDVPVSYTHLSVSEAQSVFWHQVKKNAGGVLHGVGWAVKDSISYDVEDFYGSDDLGVQAITKPKNVIIGTKRTLTGTKAAASTLTKGAKTGGRVIASAARTGRRVVQVVSGMAKTVSVAAKAGKMCIRDSLYRLAAPKRMYGIEHGSAEWGSRRDSAPLKSKDPDQNIVLSATEQISMGQAKNYEHDRNKNVIVVGGSGSGKTVLVKENLMQLHKMCIRDRPLEGILVFLYSGDEIKYVMTSDVNGELRLEGVEMCIRDRCTVGRADGQRQRRRRRRRPW